MIMIYLIITATISFMAGFIIRQPQINNLKELIRIQDLGLDKLLKEWEPK